MSETDQVGDAVAAVENKVQMVKADLTLPSGHTASLIVPVAMTPVDALAIVSAVGELFNSLADARRKEPSILVPKAGLILPT